MSVTELLRKLSKHRNAAEVVAVTPHGSYVFEIVGVDGWANDTPVLRLVEKAKPWPDVQVRPMPEADAEFDRNWWRNR